MKIARIEVYPLVLPVAEIYGGAAGFLEDCRTLIVRLEGEDGTTGWGEATQGRPGNTYETLETMEIMVRRYFAPALAGMELEPAGALLDRLGRVRTGHPMAKAALETALYDALGKIHRAPVYRLLGGPYRREIALVGGLGMELGPDRIGARARELKESGYRAFKIKIGSEEPGRDIERVRLVREAVGGEALIRVDGNARYALAEARELLRALAPYGLADAEQPLARSDLESLAALRRETAIPIALQESVSSPEEARAALAAGAADLAKVKLTHIGGFRRGLEVARIFGAKGLPIVVGQGSACTAILSAAEMHLHAALENAQPGGEMTGFLRLGEPNLCGGIEASGGKALLTEKPGLGVEIEPAYLRFLSPS